MVDYGVDVKSDWSFIDGDIHLAETKDNMGQAVANRLNTMQDELDLYYSDYGSFLQTFLGWRRTDQTLKFMKVELDSVLAKDPRINSFSSELSYADDGIVRIDLRVDDLDLSFVLSSNGVLEV